MKLECINEASLHIDTARGQRQSGQGSIAVGSVKATSAVLRSPGAQNCLMGAQHFRWPHAWCTDARLC